MSVPREALPIMYFFKCTIKLQLPVKTVTLCRRPIIPFIKHTCHAHENLLNKSGQFSPTKLRFLELIQLRSIIVMATYQIIRGHQPYLTTSQMYKYKRSVNTTSLSYSQLIKLSPRVNAIVRERRKSSRNRYT